MNYNWKDLDHLIKNSKRIVLSTHEKPDGDGLGSSIAFYYYLKKKNIDVRIIQPSPYPLIYKIIDPEKVVETYNNLDEEWIKSCDLLILFDIGHYSRAGSVSKIAIDNNINIACIDHHKNKDEEIFCTSIIDIDIPATGQLVWKYLKSKDFNKSWDIKIAKALYAAVVTDTGSFRYNNTNSESHIMASELIDMGVMPYDIYVPIYEQKNMSELRLLSYVIDNLKFSINNTVCSAIINPDILSKTNSNYEDIDGFTEFMRAIKNIEVSFLMTVQKDNSIRVNFRSKGKIIINDIAAEFGGGGHKFAAGCKISKSNILEIEEKIVNLIKLKMDN
jgi:phosphoesterase RecJ-like protein